MRDNDSNLQFKEIFGRNNLFNAGYFNNSTIQNAFKFNLINILSFGEQRKIVNM
jgi:hypothetical protein